MIYRIVLSCIKESCIKESWIALFADDNVLYNFKHKAKDEFCNDVKIAQSWFTDSKLTIITNKCETLSFAASEVFLFEAFVADIQAQSHRNCLGVYLDIKRTSENT